MHCSSWEISVFFICFVFCFFFCRALCNALCTTIVVVALGALTVANLLQIVSSTFTIWVHDEMMMHDFNAFTQRLKHVKNKNKILQRCQKKPQKLQLFPTRVRKSRSINQKSIPIFFLFKCLSASGTESWAHAVGTKSWKWILLF